MATHHGLQNGGRRQPGGAGAASLDAAFFARSAPALARDLLGCVLLHEPEDGAVLRAGRIVEVEAYDETDAASHSFRRATSRTQAMFGAGGHAYVYRSYGLHWCINVTCGPQGYGAAVLLRALQPCAGEASMQAARHLPGRGPLPHLALCRGPGNLTRAMGIAGHHNACSLMRGALRLFAGDPVPDHQILAGRRIGISIAQEVPWRFFVRSSPYVSGPRVRAPPG